MANKRNTVNFDPKNLRNVLSREPREHSKAILESSFDGHPEDFHELTPVSITKIPPKEGEFVVYKKHGKLRVGFFCEFGDPEVSISKRPRGNRKTPLTKDDTCAFSDLYRYRTFSADYDDLKHELLKPVITNKDTFKLDLDLYPEDFALVVNSPQLKPGIPIAISDNNPGEFRITYYVGPSFEEGDVEYCDLVDPTNMIMLRDLRSVYPGQAYLYLESLKMTPLVFKDLPPVMEGAASGDEEEDVDDEFLVFLQTILPKTVLKNTLRIVSGIPAALRDEEVFRNLPLEGEVSVASVLQLDEMPAINKILVTTAFNKMHPKSTPSPIRRQPPPVSQPHAVDDVDFKWDKLHPHVKPFHGFRNPDLTLFRFAVVYRIYARMMQESNCKGQVPLHLHASAGKVIQNELGHLFADIPPVAHPRWFSKAAKQLENKVDGVSFPLYLKSNGDKEEMTRAVEWCSDFIESSEFAELEE